MQGIYYFYAVIIVLSIFLCCHCVVLNILFYKLFARLLGPDAQNLPRVLSTGGGLRDNRLLVVENGFGVFTNSREEEAIDFVDQSVDLLGPSLSISMHTNPTALNWWNQEGRICKCFLSFKYLLFI